MRKRQKRAATPTLPEISSTLRMVVPKYVTTVSSQSNAVLTGFFICKDHALIAAELRLNPGRPIRGACVLHLQHAGAFDMPPSLYGRGLADLGVDKLRPIDNEIGKQREQVLLLVPARSWPPPSHQVVNPQSLVSLAPTHDLGLSSRHFANLLVLCRSCPLAARSTPNNNECLRNWGR